MWELSGNELIHNLSWNTRPQSSQLAEPLWTDPCLKSGVSMCELISTYQKMNNNNKKPAGWEEMVQHSPQNPSKQGMSPHHHQDIYTQYCVFWPADPSFATKLNLMIYHHKLSVLSTDLIAVLKVDVTAKFWNFNECSSGQYLLTTKPLVTKTGMAMH